MLKICGFRQVFFFLYSILIHRILIKYNFSFNLVKPLNLRDEGKRAKQAQARAYNPALVQTEGCDFNASLECLPGVIRNASFHVTTHWFCG